MGCNGILGGHFFINNLNLSVPTTDPPSHPKAHQIHALIVDGAGLFEAHQHGLIEMSGTKAAQVVVEDLPKLTDEKGGREAMYGYVVDTDLYLCKIYTYMCI